MKTSKMIALAIENNSPAELFAAITVASGMNWSPESIERHIVDNGGSRLLARARKLGVAETRKAGKAGIAKLGARLAKHRKAVAAGKAEKGTLRIGTRTY